MSNDRFVAMLDILGFSDIVRNVDLQELEEIVTSLKSTINSFGWANNELLEMLMLSDTIIIWTTDDTALSFQHLVATVSALMFNAFSLDNIALRGAVTVGEAMVFSDEQISRQLKWNKMIIGKAVIQANKYEKSQDWSGCLITSAAIERSRENSHNAHFPIGEWEKFNVLLYSVPFKQNVVQEAYVLNWPSIFFAGNQLNGLSDSEIKEKFKSYGRNIDSEDIKTKFENTLKFIRHCEKINREN
jgi:hypothetical protein